MKRTLLFLLLFFLSFTFCYSQPKGNLESNQIKNELLDSIAKLNKQINGIGNKMILSDSSFNNKFNTLTKAIDTTNKSINDSRLRESLKSAENTINYQNAFIQIFEVIFGVIAFLAGFLYFFSIRPLSKQADKALERANTATDKLEAKITNFNTQVDYKLSTRFELYEKDFKEKVINEIFVDLESNLPNQKKLQIEKLTTLEAAVFTSDKIDRLFRVIDSTDLSGNEKSIILEVLIQLNNYQVQKYFEIWKNVKNEEITILDMMYNYYMNSDFRNYIVPITNFILNRIEPHLEFNRLLDMLPSHPEYIILLINCQSLIDSLNTHSRASVIAHINESLNSWNLVEPTKVNSSYLFQKE